MTLETPRLILQPFTSDDLKPFIQLHKDAEVNQYLMPTGAWSREISKTKFRRHLEHWKKHSHGRFSLRLKDDSNTFIGHAGGVIWPETGEIEFGYAISPFVWNQGCTTEAAQTLIPWIFETTTLEYIIAFAFTDNLLHKKSSRKFV